MENVDDGKTRRPLTGFEQFFHDDPRRPVSEGKLIFTGTRLRCAAGATQHRRDRDADNEQPLERLKAVEDAARTAWQHTCSTWRYLRHVIEESSDPEGDPLLVERDMAHVTAQLPVTVRVFDAALLTGRQSLLIDGTEVADESERLDVLVEAEQKRERFDVAVSLGWIAIGHRTARDKSSAAHDLSVGFIAAHSGADGRSVFGMLATFMRALDAALGGRPLPEADEETAAAAAIVPNGELGVPMMKVFRSPLVLPHAAPDELVVPLIPPSGPPLQRGDAVEMNIVRDSLTAEETQLLARLARRAGTSVQSVLSVAGALAAMAGAPSTARDVFLASPDSRPGVEQKVKIGCFVPVQIRGMCDPPLPPSAVVVGGAAVWLYGYLTSCVTLLGLAVEVNEELQRKLEAGEAYGFLKMYLKPPGSTEPHYVRLANTAKGAASVRHLTTLGLSNIGLNACSALQEHLPATTTLSDPFVGMINFARTTPPTEFVRGQAFTFNHRLSICFSFTKPSYTRAAVKALLRDTLTIVRMLVAVMAGSLPDPTVRGVVESLMK